MLNCILVFVRDPGSQVRTGDLVSRSFLLSLWRKELAWFAALICMAVLAVAWIALRDNVSHHATVDSNPINITKRLKELTEEL